MGGHWGGSRDSVTRSVMNNTPWSAFRNLDPATGVPGHPARLGYRIGGWYTPGGTNILDMRNNITSNHTFWPLWFPTIPTITHPTNNQLVSLENLTVQWNLVPGATYVISVRDLTANPSVLLYDHHPVSGTRFTIPQHRLTAGHRYRVAVRARAVGVDQWAEVEFWVAATLTITQPMNGQHVPRPNATVRWTAVPGATYVISIRDLDRNQLIFNHHPVNVNWFTIPQTQLTVGHQYRVAVRARTDWGEQWDDVTFRAVAMPAHPTVPTAPRGPFASQDAAALAWSNHIHSTSLFTRHVSMAG